VEITYASGVEPCYVLDSIVVERGDHAFTITLRQGHGPGDAVCIQLAEIVRSFVDLGELQPARTRSAIPERSTTDLRDGRLTDDRRPASGVRNVLRMDSAAYATIRR
jgi:hypothetical protein